MKKQKEISIEEAKRIAISLHRKICSHSKSPEIIKHSLAVFDGYDEIRIREEFENTTWIISAGISTIYLHKSGRFGRYQNSLKRSLKGRSMGRDKGHIIRNREQATQWANLYKQYFKAPPKAKFRIELYGENMSPNAENPVGTVYAFWSLPPPAIYPLYWNSLHGKEKKSLGEPFLYLTIDPLDGTLVEAGETWHGVMFRTPILKITREQAIAIARPIAPLETYRRYNSGGRIPGHENKVPPLGTPRAELCYKVPSTMRSYLKFGKLVQEYRSYPEKAPRIREFILVWNVRFGGYMSQETPHFLAEVNIDAETGEVVDNGPY
jgi:hypothetical protein